MSKLQLPEVDPSHIVELRQQYEEASSSGGGKEAAQACLRLVWGLVHSKRRTDTEAGLRLADALLQSDDLDNQSKNDLIYLRCVALYRTGNYIGVRDQLEEFLKRSPENRQACALKEAADDKLIKDGLIGIGLFGTVAVVVGGIAAAALSRR